MRSKPPKPMSSSCGASIEEIATGLIATRFVQFHLNGQVVAASLSGSRRRPTLTIAVAAHEPHAHSTSIRPLKGTAESNYDSICSYLRHSVRPVTDPEQVGPTTEEY